MSKRARLKKRRLSAPKQVQPGERVPGPPDDSPLSFIQDEGERLAAAGDRATDSLFWALNAQLEVADYQDRDLCFQRASILHALAVAKSATELIPLVRAASKLLAASRQRPIVPGKVYDVKEASDLGIRLQFLTKTRDVLLARLKPGEGAVDGVRSYAALQEAADSRLPSRNAPRRARAARVAQAIIHELFLDAGYGALHPQQLRAADLSRVIRRTARAIEFLMERQRATPVNVAFATLFLLGRPARDRRNMFSAKATEPVAHTGAQSG